MSWEDSFVERIGEVREKELALFRRAAIVMSLFQTMMQATPIVVCVLTLGLFAMLGPVQDGVSSEKARKFAEKRIPEVVKLLADHGCDVFTATIGQGLMYLCEDGALERRGLPENWPGCSIQKTMW